MAKKRKLNSRWLKGNARYDERTITEIDRKYSEQPGFYKGARVVRKTKRGKR